MTLYVFHRQVHTDEKDPGRGLSEEANKLDEELPVSPIETEEPGTSDALEFQDDEGLTYKCNYLSVCANVSANKILRRFEAIWKLTNYT